MSDFLSERKAEFKNLGEFLGSKPHYLVVVLLLAATTLLAFNSLYDRWSGLDALTTKCTKSEDYESKQYVKSIVSVSLSILAILAGIAMTVFLADQRGVRIISLSILIVGVVGLLLTVFTRFPDALFSEKGTVFAPWFAWIVLIVAAVILDFRAKQSE